MICPKCKIDVVPDKSTHRCPECWSVLPKTTTRGGIPKVAWRRLNEGVGYRSGIDLSLDYRYLMMKFNRMYDYEDDRYSSVEILEGDTVIEIEERVVVSVVVTAAIISFFVLNEIFGFINY